MARDYYDRDRNMWDRGRDEVRSWFGDEEAERRRMYDQRQADWEDQSRQRGNPYRRDARRDMADAEFDRDWDVDDNAQRGPFRNEQYSRGWHERNPESNYGGSREGLWGSESQDMNRRGGRYQEHGSSFGGRTHQSGSGVGRSGSGEGRYSANPYGSHRYYSDYYNDESGGGEDYSGRGPGGYRRSDDRIREEVNEALTWDRRVDATDISVEVSDGVATLSGHVRDRSMKRRAEDLTENVRGVKDVHNRISVSANSGAATSSDTAGTHGKGSSSSEGTEGGNQSHQNRDFKI